MNTLEQLGYKALQVYYKDNIKIIICNEGAEKTVDGKPFYFTWDELQALNQMKQPKTTEDKQKQPESTENNLEKPKVTKDNLEKPSETKRRGPYKLNKVYTVIDRLTGDVVVRGKPSTEAYKDLGLSSVNSFRIILSNQKNGRPHKRWEIRE